MDNMKNHGGDILDRKILDFSVNLNPFPKERLIKNVIMQYANEALYYGDIYSRSYLAPLSRMLNTKEEMLIVGNGATDLIDRYARIHENENVMIVEPTFYEYKRSFNQAKCKCIGVNRENLICRLEKENPSVLVLCNPNNPTGEYYSPTEIYEMLDSFDGEILLDLSFSFFSSSDYEVFSDRIISLYSLTKCFAIPGIRLGAIKANENIIKNIENLMIPWGVNCFAQAILKELDEFSKPLFEERERVRKLIDKMQRDLSLLKGIKVYPSHTIFHMIYSELPIKERLLERGINIRKLSANYYRIAVRKESENIKLIKELSSCLE